MEKADNIPVEVHKCRGEAAFDLQNCANYRETKLMEPLLWERAVDPTLAAEVSICDKQCIYSTFLIESSVFGMLWRQGHRGQAEAL